MSPHDPNFHRHLKPLSLFLVLLQWMCISTPCKWLPIISSQLLLFFTSCFPLTLQYPWHLWRFLYGWKGQIFHPSLVSRTDVSKLALDCPWKDVLVTLFKKGIGVQEGMLWWVNVRGLICGVEGDQTSMLIRCKGATKRGWGKCVVSLGGCSHTLLNDCCVIYKESIKLCTHRIKE